MLQHAYEKQDGFLRQEYERRKKRGRRRRRRRREEREGGRKGELMQDLLDPLIEDGADWENSNLGRCGHGTHLPVEADEKALDESESD
jgi:hypothetical protein